MPDLGYVPPKMYAQLIRPARFGEPRDAFQREVVEVPELGPHDVLVYVMAAGVNYNNVWAAMGIPIDVIKTRQKKGEKEAFHIGGSDASGVVWKTGRDVTSVKVGDEVVLHCGMWEHDDPHVVAGKDPAIAPTQRIWGYESNWGSFAQFTKVQDHQCLPKPQHLSWEEAAAYTLVGATAYRMLMGWQPNIVHPGDPVLIWGGAGGLGSMAIQIVKAFGGRAVAVVSGDDKVEYCKKLGAVGVIDRRRFKHWGMLPKWTDELSYEEWLVGARAFGKAFWEALGEKKSPSIVFEHPGQSTIPTSGFVCDTGGMIVICAGTTGYNATLDLRYHWMRQKRFQGSHFANDQEAQGFNNLVIEGKADPCLSKVFPFDGTGECHQLMRDNLHPSGNMSILVNAKREGMKTL
ncbi:MAG TPA: crotonyl-CoA carboxylase/reductase [Kofleriaceae bacterium]|nr:crotonyl-CoA carboxylase/reductase [Kofleriaceae bacterium]